MKMLWIQSENEKEKSNYAQTILDALQFQYGFHIVASSEATAPYADKDNLIVIHTVQQSRLRSLLGGNSYRSLLKKWHIGGILLLDIFFKVETNLPQTYIAGGVPLSFKEDEKKFIQKHLFSFLTYDDTIKKEIAALFPQKDIRLFNSDISGLFKPLSWDDAIAIKEAYAGSEDYFLVNSIGQPIQYSVQILKGFSIFKNWQKSNMKILFLTDDIQTMQHTISNYKYREDVRVINQPDEPELANIIAASYCTVHLTPDDSDNIFVRQSVQCNIPVLLKKNSAVLRWLDNNAFFIEEMSVETIGRAFIAMYKAENIRAHHAAYMKQNPLPVPTEGLEYWIGKR